jgi:uncharacterized protein YkwD
MTLVSRRTLIVSAASVLPARLSFAEEDTARLAERLIEAAVNQGRMRLAPELPALIDQPMLDAIARERSADMSHGAPFAHEDLERFST